jgi:hypothetical protein
MADLLDELRDANPVVGCDPVEIETMWPLLDARVPTSPEPRARRARARWRVPAVMAGALAAAVVVLSVLGGDGGDSIVARAYAAMDARGVVIHWVSTSSVSSPNRSSVRHEEAWISGPDAHTIISGTYPVAISSGGQRISYEAALNGNVLRRYDAIKHLITTARLVGSGSGPGLPQDPLQTFRDFYNRGRVEADGTRIVAGHRVNVLIVHADAQARPTVVFYVDAKTAAPVEFISYSYSPGHRLNGTITTVFQTYERLPLTPRTRALLSLLPHPGAKQTPTTSRQRGGAPQARP